MPGSLDDERVHLVPIPHGFEFLVYLFHRPGGAPMAVLRRNALCRMTDREVADWLTGVADKLVRGELT